MDGDDEEDKRNSFALEILTSGFPHVPTNYIADILAQCDYDDELASNLIE